MITIKKEQYFPLLNVGFFSVIIAQLLVANFETPFLRETIVVLLSVIYFKTTLFHKPSLVKGLLYSLLASSFLILIVIAQMLFRK